MKALNLKTKKIKIEKSQIKDIFKGVLFSLVITLLAVLTLGIIIKFVDVPSNVLLPINQVIKVISLLIGCLLGFKNKSTGAVKGCLVGLVYTLISIFIFLIVGGSLKNSFNFIDLIMGILIGAISGIIAVNTGKRQY